jgi:signal transduction histidine kinase
MSDSRKMWRMYWMPASVLLIGILSIILLLWADRIREQDRNDCALVNTIEEAEIRVATSHLWLEQALSRDGKEPADSSQSFADLDHAIGLVDLTLKGGRSEHGLISEPLTARELRAQAELIRSLLLKFKGIGLLRLKKKGEAGSGSVLDLQSHPVFREILLKASKLEDMVESDRERGRTESTRLFLVIISSWAVILLTATVGLWGREKQRVNAEDALMKANKTLLSQAEELTEHRKHLSEQVERRTAELTSANALLQDEIGVRRLAEEALRETEGQIRELSSQLLAAQEVERSRISRELHDGLGQSLNVMKLRIRFIEQRLGSDQADIRNDCEELLAYASQVIEDVRRLSRDLSPTVLSDLGLTSAVRWLVNDFAKNQAVKARLDITEIDDLFEEKSRIIIFRIIQELLTNIGKHSQAGNVYLAIRRDGDRVIFQLEDDGKGFDPGTAYMKGSEKGLGLASIKERIRMMGGLLDLRSGEGKGTHVTFSIPVGNKEV